MSVKQVSDILGWAGLGWSSGQAERTLLVHTVCDLARGSSAGFQLRFGPLAGYLCSGYNLANGPRQPGAEAPSSPVQGLGKEPGLQNLLPRPRSLPLCLLLLLYFSTEGPH